MAPFPLTLEMTLDELIDDQGKITGGSCSVIRSIRSNSQRSEPYVGRSKHLNDDTVCNSYSLVQGVKDLQRTHINNCKTWRQYCDEHGDGSYDPQRYPDFFLKAALAHIGRKGGLKKLARFSKVQQPLTQLTESVKRLQRSSNDVAETWKQYCIDSGNGSFDPMRYDSEFLYEWLKRMLCNRSLTAESLQKSLFVLVEMVKEAQRSSGRTTKSWREHCSVAGHGSYDPSRHSAGFLWEWLSKEGMLETNWDGTAVLCEEVKTIQRSSKEARESWRSYCCMEGNGTFDPVRHNSNFLKEWIWRMQINDASEG